jgi:hypothetical protein
VAHSWAQPAQTSSALLGCHKTFWGRILVLSAGVGCGATPFTDTMHEVIPCNEPPGLA